MQIVAARAGGGGAAESPNGPRALDTQSVDAELNAARVEGALLAARTMRHHLNNRLALTLGYMELLASDPDMPPHLAEIAAKAMQGARDASVVIKRLQRLQRIELEPDWDGAPILDMSKIDGA